MTRTEAIHRILTALFESGWDRAQTARALYELGVSEMEVQGWAQRNPAAYEPKPGARVQ